jgi:hypothetical protein
MDHAYIIFSYTNLTKLMYISAFHISWIFEAEATDKISYTSSSGSYLLCIEWGLNTFLAVLRGECSDSTKIEEDHSLYTCPGFGPHMPLYSYVHSYIRVGSWKLHYKTAKLSLTHASVCRDKELLYSIAKFILRNLCRYLTEQNSF